MEPLLFVLLAVATLSLALNAAYILHELGWFPHGKKRDRPDVRRQPRHVGHLPTAEEARRENDDVQARSPFTRKLRRAAHADVYKLDDPLAQLRSALARYREQRTPSRRDDVLNLMNAITTKMEVSGPLATALDDAITATQEPVFSGPSRQER